MKNMFLCLMLATFLAIPLKAASAPVDKARARDIAAGVMAKWGASPAQEPMRAPGRHLAVAHEPVYIFNAGGQKGFVIVSGDDRADMVLGYSDEGCYDEDNMPENFKAWVKGYADEIECFLKMPGNANYVPRQMPQHDAIAPLLQSIWGQGNPYNSLCPLVGGYHAVTGCIATAGAQYMYYYKYPTEEVPSIPGYQNVGEVDTSQDLPPIVFDWENMKPDLFSSYNQQSITAVAQLMFYCGFASKLKYGSNSGGQFGNLVNALVDYFDYDDTNSMFVTREYFSIEGWDSLVYHELEMHRPLLYSGIGKVGHVFLCDGYDGEGCYHINWGWNGSGNGFFRLQALAPDTHADPSDPGYIYSQNAVFGLQPKGWPLEEWDWRDDGTQPEEPVMNLRVDTFYIDNSYQAKFTITNLGDNYDDVLYIYNDTHSLANLPVRIKSGATRSFAVRLFWYEEKSGNLSFDLCTKSKEKVLATTQMTILPPILEATDFQVIGSRMAGMIHRVDVTVTNSGGEFWKPLYLRVSPMSETYVADAAIPKDGSDVVTFYFQPDYNANYRLTVYRDQTFDYPIGSTTVDIGTISVKNVEYTGNMLASCGQTFNMTIENPMEADFDGTIYLFQSQTQNKGFYVIGTGLKLPKGETVVKKMSFGPTLPGVWNLWVTIKDNGLGVIWNDQVDITNLIVKDIRVEGNQLAGSPQQVTATIENPGGEFMSELCLYASQTDHLGSYVSLAQETISAGATETVTFSFTPEQAGVWNLWIGTDRRALNILDSRQVEINEVPTDISERIVDTDGSHDCYTLDGRKINGQPTQKGIYIKNRRKIVLTSTPTFN